MSAVRERRHDLPTHRKSSVRSGYLQLKVRRRLRARQRLRQRLCLRLRLRLLLRPLLRLPFASAKNGEISVADRGVRKRLSLK